MACFGAYSRRDRRRQPARQPVVRDHRPAQYPRTLTIITNLLDSLLDILRLGLT